MISIIIFLVFLICSYIGISQFLPDYYWFESFNYHQIFTQTIEYKILIFVATFIPTITLFLINNRILNNILFKASVTDTQTVPANTTLAKLKLIIQTFFGQYKDIPLNISNKIKTGLYIFLTFFIAKFATNFWIDILMALKQTPFSVTDPIFYKDIAFYMFTLPTLSGGIGLIKFIVWVILLVSLWVYLKKGHFLAFFSTSFTLIRSHIFGLLTLLFSLNAVTAYLSKYQLLFKQNNILFGANYTDLAIRLKVLSAMPIVWAIVALIALIFIVRPNIKLLGIAAALIFIPNILFLNLIPSIMQSYIVNPNEYNKEKPNIETNIKYTQLAYGLNNIQEIDVNYKKTISNFNSASFKSTLDNVRLWNPGPLKSTLKQLQEMRLYYEFKNVDVDRYIINNKPQQVMLSARELDFQQVPQKAQTWVNQHLMYTHGYGLCMVPVNQFTSEGLPELIIRDIPPISKTNINIKRPEIYFGESTNHYVITNTKQAEFDYPKDNENKYAHYQGPGGITLSSFFKRLIYALKLKDIKILISQNIHNKSKLMYNRNIHQIPREITPFITYDNNPYLVVTNQGNLLWIIDGYTTSNQYPYATPYGRTINYIRNSVMATVDAYSGETTFYIKDASDPIVATYSNIFPSLFQPLSALPQDIRDHLRFPKDLFKVTTKMYNTYHMTDPQVFYNKEDVWTFPTETYDADSGIIMDPYYMYIQNPKSKQLDYSIMVPLTPSNKNNLVSILTASCEPNNFGKLTIYKFPKQETVYGPLQIESRIDQNTEISKDLTLWGQVGSRVIRGNLMVIPYEDTILYVEPIYLQATQSKLPELKRVIVALGDHVSMTTTISEGIAELSKGTYTKQTSNTQENTTKQPNMLTKKIIQTYAKIKKTLRSADWKSFGEQFETLDKLINQLKKEP
jgi:uncharacterized protein